EGVDNDETGIYPLVKNSASIEQIIQSAFDQCWMLQIDGADFASFNDRVNALFERAHARPTGPKVGPARHNEGRTHYRMAMTAAPRAQTSKSPGRSRTTMSRWAGATEARRLSSRTVPTDRIRSRVSPPSRTASGSSSATALAAARARARATSATSSRALG